jgi:pimeloyl-ACP methyl ester carboxylesterase
MNPRPPLVLIPGLLCDEAVWRHQVDALSDLVSPIVITLREDEDMPSMARRVLELAPERFALAGFSMGGYVALEVMRQAGQRVTRLALLDTSAQPDNPDRIAGRMRMIELAKEGRLSQVIKLNYPLWVHQSRLGDKALAETIRDMNLRIGSYAYERQQHAIMGRADSRPLLPEIKCPTLVLCGDSDVLTPVANHDEMAAAIPGAHQVIIAECGHMSTMEKPEAVTAAMRAWLTAQ